MEQIINYFLQPENGVLGIIVVMLLGVVIWQQRKLDTREKEITTLHEKRKADADSYTSSYTAVAREQIAATRDNINTVNLLQRSIDSLATALQAFINGSKRL
jgi:uncharacterized membrane protein YccC